MQNLLDNTRKLFVPSPEYNIKPVPKSNLKKIGTDYGGWVVPTNLLNEYSICYCVGCGEDISFDLGLIDNLSCDVYGFDPTPRAIDFVKSVAANNPRYHFYEYGLWDCEDRLKFFVPKNPEHVSHSLVNLQSTDEYIYVRVKRLSQIMSDLGHHKIDLLKIDIEGAEYKVIESIIEDNINISVLCVEYDEYHNPIDTNFESRIKTSINSLLSMGYSMLCAQGNGNFTFVKTITINQKPNTTCSSSIQNSPLNFQDRQNHYDSDSFESKKQIDTFGGFANVFKFKDWIRPHHTVVDFGCSGGLLLDQLEAKNKVGIEINAAARAEALRKGIFAVDSIDLIPDNIADAIISNHTLGHLGNPLQSLNKLRTKLKNEGRAIFVVPHNGPNECFREDDITDHLYTWNPQTLGNLFKSAGYKVIAVEAFQHQWPPNYLAIYEEQGETAFHDICRMHAKKNGNYQIRIVALGDTPL